MLPVKKGNAASYDVIGSMERICYYIYGPRRCGMSTLIRDLLLTIDRQATYQIATIDDEIQSDADVLFIESNAPPTYDFNRPNYYGWTAYDFNRRLGVAAATISLINI